MDSQYKIGGKISIIDLAIVFIIAFLIIVALNFLLPKKVLASSQISYTVELYKMPVGFSEKIKVGDTLYDNAKGYKIGTIEKVYTKPFTESAPDFSNNIVKMAPVDGFEYVYIDVTSPGNVVDGSTKIGDYEVMVGNNAYVKTGTFASSGYVVGLKN